MSKSLSKQEQLNLLWFRVTGAIIIVMSFLICGMDGSFIYDIPQHMRPIPIMVFYLLIWFIAYFFALERIRKMQNSDTPTKNLIWIFFVSVVIRILFFPPHAIQETDFFRYFWDGQAVIQGANPYNLSPQESYLLNEKPAINGNSEMEEVFKYISFPDVKTIYPPLAQYLFASSQLLTPWSAWGWKGMIFVVDGLIIWILMAMLGHLKIRKEWIVLYAWSPLILKEFLNNLHLDIFALLFLCLVIYGLVRKWTAFSFIALACAVMVKWFALILLPLLIRATWRTPKQSVLNIGLFLSVIVLLYRPFVSAGESLWEGLITFSLNWKVNAGLFNLISFFFQSLSLPEDLVRLSGRFTIALIFAVISIFVMRWFWNRRDALSFCQSALILTASLFFLIPTGNPWYYSWTFPFLLFFPVRSLILFSGLVLLYYLDFYLMYQNQRDLFEWIRWVEYGIFFIVLGVELWIKNKQLPLLSRFTTRVVSLERR
ncbi:MAG: hypothetical protein AB7S78_05590 [Candidatus Omnitrophota bacterium]